MKIGGIRIEIMLLALVIALAIFFGGQYLIREYYIGQPLQEELQALEEVKEAELLEVGSENRILVTLNPVDNILRTHEMLQDFISERLGKRPFTLQLKNNNQQLDDLYYQLHYLLYQSLAHSEYVELARELEVKRKELELDEAAFFLDQKHLYLQLISGQEAYYRIIPRPEGTIKEKGGRGQ